jgi:glycerate kinase
MTDTGSVPSIPGIPTTVLVAPDSFKGTFDAGTVARAIGAGLQDAGRPVDLCPVADGGEGTLHAVMTALGGELQTVSVSDPLGRPVEAAFGLVSGSRRGLERGSRPGSETGSRPGSQRGSRPGSQRGEVIGVVETASASGLHLVADGERDALAATTYGTGELIAAAVAAGARTVYLGVGGSATTDGGTGALRAIADAGGLANARVIVLCDVRTPFEDAARVFGPQKGASPLQVRELGARLDEIARGFSRDPRGVPMTGAAGGLSGALWAELGAELVPGAAFVLDAVSFDTRMRAARAVVTGEGKLDQQSLAGKLVSEIATRARQAGVPCHAIVGTRQLDAFGLRVLDLQAVFEATTVEEIESAARRLAELL